MGAAALLAITIGLAAYGSGSWQRVERDTIDMRFAVRGPAHQPPEVVIVAIDDRTFSSLQLQWPFPRTLHAALINRLRAAHAKVIAYDVQFTEPSRTESEDIALYDSISRARNVVLATTEVDSQGHSNVLGGEANLRQAGAVAAASNLPADAGGVIRRYPYALLGLHSFAVAAVQAAGGTVSPGRFQRDGALIDFRGPPGSIRTVSFSDVLSGAVNPRALAGKIVVVGVSAPTLQDVHPTSTASATPMSGPEIQASAIWTALHDNPLQPAPAWVALAAIILLGASAPLAGMRLGVFASGAVAATGAVGYLAVCQAMFNSGTVMVVSYPLATWATGTIGMVAAGYIAALAERAAFEHQLHDSQLELVHRLAHTVESRDAETGEHIKRIGVLSERLALEIGWSSQRAEILKHATVMHDIGKIGIPDSVLLKPGPLDRDEWELVKGHTTAGAEMLAGSANPIVQMAEEVARSHHEHWDGTGYPYGLAGEEIPLAGRICAVVDVYDALLSKRSYKEAWRVDQVLDEIRRGSASHFDPLIVEAFLRVAPRLTGQLEPMYERTAGAPIVRPAASPPG